VFGDEVGRRVTTFKKAWQVTLLRASGYQPEWTKGRLTDGCRQRLAEIDLHFHDLRHHAEPRIMPRRFVVSTLLAEFL
jgi:hypothetical protein